MDAGEVASAGDKLNQLIEGEDESSFVSSNPIETLEATVHTMDRLGWFPEAQRETDRSLSLVGRGWCSFTLL